MLDLAPVRDDESMSPDRLARLRDDDGTDSEWHGVRRRRVLIVDDQAANRTLVNLMLRGEEFTCQEAPNGMVALKMLALAPVDVVLLDIDMPKMTGVEVLGLLRENPPCPHLKVIMISGRANADEMSRIMLTGADDFLEKPFTACQLTARLKNVSRLKDAQDRADLMQRNLLETNDALERHLAASHSDLVEARNGLVLALAELVACRDHETGAHLNRIQRYIDLLAKRVAATRGFRAQMDDAYCALLECCAPLHDIGKAALPDTILLKPGRLTEAELDVVKTHTTIGANLLKKVGKKHGFARPFVEMAHDICRHHHERFDGKGYPDGLAGDAIPLAARLGDHRRCLRRVAVATALQGWDAARRGHADHAAGVRRPIRPGAA